MNVLTQITNTKPFAFIPALVLLSSNVLSINIKDNRNCLKKGC